jgi:hypothetical protein
MSASLQLPGGLITLNPQPEIARYYNTSGNVYTNTVQVLSQIVLAARYVGQTFMVGTSEYWFNPTTADADLKIKLINAASQISAIPHTDYLISNTVQGQLDQTETNIVGLYKLDKTDFKNLYQTGLARVDADVSVLTISPANTLTITACDRILYINEILIDTPANKVADYLKDFGTKVFVVNGTNTPLAINTRGIVYVALDKLGNPVYRNAGKVYDQDVCYMARLLIQNSAGVYTIISVKYLPDLANNRPTGRDRAVTGSGNLVWSGAASISFGNKAVSYLKNSINYSNNKLDPNYLVIADSVNPTPMQFLFMIPNITSLATSIALSTTIDPSQWYTSAGTIGAGAVNNTSYQVYRLVVTVTGTLAIQTVASTVSTPVPGVNAIFANKDDANAGLTSVVFTDPLPAGDSIPIGTFYLRAGTPANGSGMNKPDDFYFRPITSSSSSSTAGVTDHDALSGKNDNPTYQHITSTEVSNFTTAYTNRITSLTTTGTSGAATLITNVLNIPNYTLAGLGGINFASVISGFVTGANTTVLNTDSLEIAIEKLQGQVNARSVISPAALSKVDDTNVTLTLGGTPLTSLLQAVSLTLGWTGTLADSRIASSAVWNAKQNALTNPITGTGTGASGQVAFFTGANSQTGDNALFWNNTNKTLSLGTTLALLGSTLTVRGDNSVIGIRGATNGSTASPVSRKLIWSNAAQVEHASIDVADSATNVVTVPMIFSTNATGLGYGERMRIHNNGNIGIGATNPLFRFHIQETNGGTFFDGTNATYNRWKSTASNITDGKDLLISAQNSGSTPDLYIKSNGYVSIGTSSPLRKLTVFDNDNQLALKGSASGNPTYLSFFNSIDTRRGYIGFPSQGVNDIRITNEETDGHIILTNTGTGKVGIGTSTPSSKLDILNTSAGALSDVVTLTNSGATANTEVGLFFSPTTTTGNIRGARISSRNDGSNNCDLRFYIGSGASILEKMNLNPLGELTLLQSDARLVGGDSVGRLVAGNSTTTSYIEFDGATNAAPNKILLNTTTGVIAFSTSSTERMRVANDGNVGIGVIPTTTSTDSLQVGGNITASAATTATHVVIKSQLDLKANSAITIATTAPLVGGGDLSANRTLSIPVATTSVNGYLSSTDWTTFNNKQAAITNNVTGTGTANKLSKFTGTNTIADSQVFDNGTNVGIGTTTTFAKLDNNGSMAINSNLSDSSTRPTIAIGVLQYGEIRGYSQNATSVDWGFLRLRAGGGAVTPSTASYIDIAGASTVTDMDRNIVFGTNGIERVRIANGGNVGIGTTAPLAKLHASSLVANVPALRTTGTASAISTSQTFFDNAAVNLGGGFGAMLISGDNSDGSFKMQTTNSTGSSASAITFNRLGGLVTIGPGGAVLALQVSGNLQYSGTITNASDARVKENIKPIENAVDTLLKLNPCTFDRIDTGKKDNIGLIAQEVEEVLPQLINIGENTDLGIKDFRNLDYVSIVPILIKAVQELKAEIEYLKSK